MDKWDGDIRLCAGAVRDAPVRRVHGASKMTDMQGQKAGTAIDVRSPSFEAGGRIPDRFTGQGEDVSPALRLGALPSRATTLALILDDPDAPRAEPFVHWMFWDLPVSVGALEEGADVGRHGAVVGKNGWDRQRYNGPMPPKGHGEHRYYFRFYALDSTLGLPPTTNRQGLERAMKGHVVAEGSLMGTFSRV